jgi:hypothetical protein
MDAGSRKNNDAMAIFGRSASQLTPVLNLLSSEGFDKVREKAEALHLVFTQKGIVSAEKFLLSTREFKEELESLALRIGQAVMPALTNFMATMLNLGLAAKGVAADLGVLLSVFSGPGGIAAALRDKQAWDEYRKGIEETKLELDTGAKALANSKIEMEGHAGGVKKASEEWKRWQEIMRTTNNEVRRITEEFRTQLSENIVKESERTIKQSEADWKEYEVFLKGSFEIQLSVFKVGKENEASIMSEAERRLAMNVRLTEQRLREEGGAIRELRMLFPGLSAAAVTALQQMDMAHQEHAISVMQYEQMVVQALDQELMAYKVHGEGTRSRIQEFAGRPRERSGQGGTFASPETNSESHARLAGLHGDDSALRGGGSVGGPRSGSQRGDWNGNGCGGGRLVRCRRREDDGWWPRAGGLCGDLSAAGHSGWNSEHDREAAREPYNHGRRRVRGGSVDEAHPGEGDVHAEPSDNLGKEQAAHACNAMRAMLKIPLLTLTTILLAILSGRCQPSTNPYTAPMYTNAGPLSGSCGTTLHNAAGFGLDTAGNVLYMCPGAGGVWTKVTGNIISETGSACNIVLAGGGDFGAATNAAEATLGATGGKICWQGGGTISTPVVMTSNVTIECSGTYTETGGTGTTIGDGVEAPTAIEALNGTKNFHIVGHGCTILDYQNPFYVAKNNISSSAVVICTRGLPTGSGTANCEYAGPDHQTLLTADAARGATSVTVTSTAGLAAGMDIVVGSNRGNGEYTIASTWGGSNPVTLSEPLEDPCLTAKACYVGWYNNGFTRDFSIDNLTIKGNCNRGTQCVGHGVFIGSATHGKITNLNCSNMGGSCGTSNGLSGYLDWDGGSFDGSGSVTSPGGSVGFTPCYFMSYHCTTRSWKVWGSTANCISINGYHMNFIDVQAEGCAVSGMVTSQAEDVHIIGGSSNSNAVQGINLVGDLSDPLTTDFEIVGVTFQSNGVCGIQLGNGGNQRGRIVGGFVQYNMDTELTTGGGICLNGPTAGTAVIGTRVCGNGRGIYVTGPTNGVTLDAINFAPGDPGSVGGCLTANGVDIAMRPTFGTLSHSTLTNLVFGTTPISPTDVSTINSGDNYTWGFTSAGGGTMPDMWTLPAPVNVRMTGSNIQQLDHIQTGNSPAAAGGFIRSSVDNLWCFRNSTNTGDTCVENTGAAAGGLPSDLFGLQSIAGGFNGFRGPFYGSLISATANQASAGQVRLASSDAIHFRNSLNTGDVVALGHSGNEVLTLGTTGGVNSAGSAKGIAIPIVTLGTLPSTPLSGTLTYCSDCLKGSNPCTGGSSGTFAFNLDGTWVCF